LTNPKKFEEKFLKEKSQYGLRPQKLLLGQKASKKIMNPELHKRLQEVSKRIRQAMPKTQKKENFKNFEKNQKIENLPKIISQGKNGFLGDIDEFLNLMDCHTDGFQELIGLF